MKKSTDSSERITRDNLEEAFRDLQGDINDNAPSMLTKVAYFVAALTVTLTIVAYIVGRRTGRRRSTVVEVRRI